MVYIYALLDEQGDPFYIGKSVNPKKRLYEHNARAKNGHKQYVYNKIRKLLRNPEYELGFMVLDEALEEEIDDKERYYIKKYKEDGYKLCNLSEGGEGGLNSETALKIAENRHQNGTSNHTEETKQKMSNASKGKPKSEQHKQALSVAWKRTPEQLKLMAEKNKITSKGKINIKKYICIDPDGNEYITEHGLTVFCEEHGLTQSLMSKVVEGKRRHHRGWIAKHYAEESDNNEPNN
jgi:predicted GIY-YIG superfamily endonuclease